VSAVWHRCTFLHPSFLGHAQCPLSGIGAPSTASDTDAAGNTCNLAHFLRNFALFVNVVAGTVSKDDQRPFSSTTIFTCTKTNCVNHSQMHTHALTFCQHNNDPLPLPPSYTYWHDSGLFLTIVGFWIIVYTLPWTSCADLGLNPVADENTDPLYVQNTNTDDYKYVKALLTTYSTCTCVSVHISTCADLANTQGHESRVHQYLHDCLDATDPLGRCLPCGTICFPIVLMCLGVFVKIKNVCVLMHALYSLF